MNDSGPNNFWRKCSSCKKEIAYGAPYYRCSVSTCQHERTGYRFCSVQCWDVHLGFQRHRSAFAEEARAPSREEASEVLVAEASSETSTLPRDPVKKIIEAKAPSSAISPRGPTALPETETLVVVSKVKGLIREQVGFNTSECCIDALTKKVVEACLEGIKHAQAAGRKTVMGRDIR